jgi:hypothetical protein
MVPVRGIAGRRGVVCTVVNRPVSTPDAKKVLGFVAESLRRHIERDSGLQAAAASLLRTGRSLRVLVELAEGDAPPRVVVASPRTTVPEWSEADHSLLRSLGISCEPLSPSAPGESGRLDPR